MEFEGLLKFVPEDRKEKYERLLSRLALAESLKEIFNAEFEDMRVGFERTHNIILDQAKEPFMHDGPGCEGLSDEQCWDIFSIRAERHIGSRIRKIQDIQTPSVQNYINTYLRPIEVIIQKMVNLKPYIKKGRKPNPDAKPVYVPPSSAKADLKKVENVLGALLEGWKVDQIADAKRWFKKTVEDYKAAELDGDKKSLAQFRHSYDWLFKRDGLVAGHEDLIDKMAVAHVVAVQKTFMEKNMSKVTSIIAEKGGLDEVVLLGNSMRKGLLEGRIKFVFSDESEFTVINQVVEVWDTYRPFQRFPTTFHDIKLPDGKVIKKESEEWMNTIFIKKK